MGGVLELHMEFWRSEGLLNLMVRLIPQIQYVFKLDFKRNDFYKKTDLIS